MEPTGNQPEIPQPRGRKTKRLRRFAFGFLLFAFALFLFEVLWPVPKVASFKTTLSDSYYIQTYHFRSPLRVLSEVVHFMPHGNVKHWGTKRGRESFIDGSSCGL